MTQILKEEIVRVGTHRVPRGAEQIQIGEYAMYVHEEKMHLMIYRGDRYLWINNIYENQVQFNAEIAKYVQQLKLETQPKVKHELAVGDILAANTNINNPFLNMVEFYQVVDIVDEFHVGLCLVEAEFFEMSNYNIASPRQGAFAGDRIERKVIANTVCIHGGRIAKKVGYRTVHVADDMDLRIYDGYQFGLKI